MAPGSGSGSAGRTHDRRKRGYKERGGRVRESYPRQQRLPAAQHSSPAQPRGSAAGNPRPGRVGPGSAGSGPARGGSGGHRPGHRPRPWTRPALSGSSGSMRQSSPPFPRKGQTKRSKYLIRAREPMRLPCPLRSRLAPLPAPAALLRNEAGAAGIDRSPGQGGDGGPAPSGGIAFFPQACALASACAFPRRPAKIESTQHPQHPCTPTS